MSCLKRFVFITFSVLALPATVFGEDLLDVHACKMPIDAEFCEKGCVRMESGMKEDYLVNKADRSVMRRTYFRGSPPTSQVLKNCTIFDDKNWDCSPESTWTGKWYVYAVYKMTNGLYVQQLYTSQGGPSPLDKASAFNPGFCSKKLSPN